MRFMIIYIFFAKNFFKYIFFYLHFRGVQCRDTITGAQCEGCPVGYEGDGRTCSLRNACLDGPCPSGK